MSEIVQQFFAANITGTAVQLSPATTGSGSGGIRGIARPPHLAIAQLTVTTVESTPPVDFWPAVTGCQRYEVTIRKVN